jgi:hypothetical protein
MPIRSPPPVNATIPTFSPRVPSPDKPTQAQPQSQSVPTIAEPPASANNSNPGTASASVTNDDQTEQENEPEPSAPASVHDDADDESELSELDEEEVQEIEQEVRRSASMAVQKSLFPNLKVEKGGQSGGKEEGGERMDVDGEGGK